MIDESFSLETYQLSVLFGEMRKKLLRRPPKKQGYTDVVQSF